MKNNGIAILVVLFILLLMSMVAININEYWLHIFFMTSTRQLQQQDKWMLLGAEMVLKKSLTQFINNESKNNNKVQQWINDIKKIHLDNVDINVKAFNASGCFNINSLYNFNKNKGMQDFLYPMEIFKNLLIYNGIKDENIDNIISILSNKIHSDSSKLKENHQYTYSNEIKLPFFSKDKLFQDVSELRFLFDFNKNSFNQLKMILCALPEKKLRININALNSLQDQLLSSIFPDVINKEQALRVIKSKPEFGWRNIHEFTNILLSQSSSNKNKLVDYKEIIESILTVEEHYFYCIFWIENNNQYYKMKSIFKITPQGIDVVQRQYGISE